MTELGGRSGETGERRPSTPDVGLPARPDMRRAFDIYVAGRSRTLAPAEKSSIVGGVVDAPYAEPPAQDPDAPYVRGSGVSVPTVLRFDRGAGTWRQSESS